MNIKKKISLYLQRALGMEAIRKDLEITKSELYHQSLFQKELLKAITLQNLILNTAWLKVKTFTPGEWAVDNGFLYTLYKVLTLMKPTNILEFGLGQSSKMVHQYADYYNIKAITCEHDQNWVNFFLQEIANQYSVDINILELETIKYNGEDTLTYKSLQTVTTNNKYDLIIVDGPFGSEHFSRSQIIELTKNNLKDRFCIMIDDYERPGEQETGKEVMKILKEAGIAYWTMVYSTSKEHLLICSSELNFLTSL